MIESQVSDWTIARYWNQDVPDEFRISSSVATVRRRLAATPSLSPSLTTAIEVRRIVGPRTVYGLLGATYKPSDGTELIIEYPVCHAIRAITSPLLTNGHANVGLPDWLAYEIADSMCEYTAQTIHPAGHISFSFGAYSEMSSNVSIFEVLAKCVLDILLSGIEITTRDQLADLLRKHL